VTSRRAKKVPVLPDSYTNIHPVGFKNKNLLPSRTDQVILLHRKLSNAEEFSWLESVRITESVNSDVQITWSAHHISMQRGRSFEVSLTSLLPLLRESAQSVATVKHVMTKIKDTVAFLNPGQVSVVAADQPIFALAK
jgi:hypothetical protein